MATLSVLSNFTMSSQGKTVAGKQGAAANTAATTFDYTVGGVTYELVGSIPTATVRTLWDEDANFPVDWDVGWFWCDQDCYLQLIGTVGNVTHRIEATFPFWIPGFDEILPAGNLTLITGGTEPTMETIDSIALGNYSGSTANFHLILID